MHAQLPNPSPQGAPATGCAVAACMNGLADGGVAVPRCKINVLDSFLIFKDEVKWVFSGKSRRAAGGAGPVWRKWPCGLPCQPFPGVRCAEVGNHETALDVLVFGLDLRGNRIGGKWAG